MIATPVLCLGRFPSLLGWPVNIVQEPLHICIYCAQVSYSRASLIVFLRSGSIIRCPCLCAFPSPQHFIFWYRDYTQYRELFLPSYPFLFLSRNYFPSHGEGAFRLLHELFSAQIFAPTFNFLPVPKAHGFALPFQEQWLVLD